MNDATRTDQFALELASAAAPRARRAPSLVERLARRAVLGRLRTLTNGSIEINEGDTATTLGSGALMAQVTIHDPATWTAVAEGGTVGAGGAFIAGQWSCDDPAALVRFFVRNRAELDGMEGGFARMTAPLRRAWHWCNRNTRDGSRRNIAAHYDLGNDFFALWLDPTMLYSSAFFAHDGMTLEAASLAKCERICRTLDLTADDHLVEIGTGWGGFAIHAARSTGCRVTTTTISQRQFDLASERVRAAGLADRIQVLLCDYRDLTGTYDKLVSIEMIEAVGHRFYDDYFRTCQRLLKPTGIGVIQAITIAEQLYATAIRSVDFIQRFVFPGSCIPSLGAITASLGRATDFNLVAVDDLTPHYVKTLRCWRDNFHAQAAKVRALGHGEEFMRLWEFYLAYCEGGFAERTIGLHQIAIARSDWRAPLQRQLDGHSG